MNSLLPIALSIILLPLSGAIMAGLLGKQIGRSATHYVTTGLVGIAFFLSCYLFYALVVLGHPSEEGSLYTWVQSGSFQFDVGLMLDRLSVVMLCVVTFISFLVHIYTIGYMADDPGYQRFFSYVSLFTFAMLALVLANNFLLLFFGWEGVGLVSYLLISFWFKRDSAAAGGLKAFLVNRVGDIGFILAIAAILVCFGHMDYSYLFSHINTLADQSIAIFPGTSISAVTLICILLFIGAMGKSAQIPLHVWLPESMEGPTPISALIHAATMVTAGIYMVARLSPLFEHSPIALSVILIVGATTCLSMGALAVFQQDIKRVIAYSTLSQLGYMTVALGVSAYDAAIFHLVTHAFFKALLFLAAGSVIIALHHEQDMRKMGGLAAYLPITYFSFAVGAIALAALPPFSGFFSKEAIIEAVHLSATPGAGYAYFCVVTGAFLTPLYIFRAFFLTFHGETRMSHEVKAHVHESPWVVLLPLLALAICSVIAGYLLIGPMLFDHPRFLGGSIFVLPQHDVLAHLGVEYAGAAFMALQAGHSITLWLSLAGIITAWWFSLQRPGGMVVFKRMGWLNQIIERKYGFDDFIDWVFVRGGRKLGEFFYDTTDVKLIDGMVVNGSGRLIRWLARVSCRVQSGYLYHYTLVIVLGLSIFLMLSWFLLGS